MQIYFDAGAQYSIFLHSWSLVVEWQFYMLYPILLYVLRPLYFKRRNIFTVILTIATFASFLLCMILIEGHSPFTFYNLPTRAWEMLLGDLALLYAPKIRSLAGSAASSFSNLALITVVGSLFCIAMILEIGLSVYLMYNPKDNLLSNRRLISGKYINYFQYENYYQFNSCSCFLTRGQQYRRFDAARCLNFDKSKRNIVLLGDSHAAQYSRTFRDNLSRHENLVEISPAFTFPFIDPKGDKESVGLIRTFYRDILPHNYKHINVLFISVHWLMKDIEGMRYSEEEIKGELLRVFALLESFKIRYYIIGQNEKYTVGFNRIVVADMLTNDINFDRYIDSESVRMNNF